MSMIDFMGNNISHNDPNLIVRYFDQIMILYNFMGTKKQNVNISVNDNDAQFEIVCDSCTDAMNLYQFLNNTHFTIYQITYNIEMQISGVTVLAKIYKVAP